MHRKEETSLVQELMLKTLFYLFIKKYSFSQLYVIFLIPS